MLSDYLPLAIYLHDFKEVNRLLSIQVSMKMLEGDLLGRGGAHRSEKSSESLTPPHRPSVHVPSVFPARVPY